MAPPDIEVMLTGGDPRALKNCDEVVDLVLRSPERTGELFDSVFSTDEIVRMRASDALEKVCAERPDLVQPFVGRVLDDMAAVDQPSVQWHLAQIVARLTLTDEQQAQAVETLHHNLLTYDDWILTNLTLASLAELARSDPTLRPGLLTVLRRHAGDRHKSVANRVDKLLTEFAG